MKKLSFRKSNIPIIVAPLVILFILSCLVGLIVQNETLPEAFGEILLKTALLLCMFCACCMISRKVKKQKLMISFAASAAIILQLVMVHAICFQKSGYDFKMLLIYLVAPALSAGLLTSTKQERRR